MTNRSICRLLFLGAIIVVGASFTRAHAEGESSPVPAEVAPEASTTPIVYGIHPHIALHAWTRAAAEGTSPATPVTGSGDLVRALEAVRAAIKDDRLWGLVDARVVGAPDAQGFVTVMESMPETQKLSSGAEISLREPGTAYARKLVEVVAAWEGAGWADAKSQLERARDEITQTLASASTDPIGFIKSSMGWESWNGSIPVELVVRAPVPGGVTFRAVKGPVCVVGVGTFEGSMRMEVLLHELMHAIDVSTDAKDAPLAKLRAALTAAGFGPNDPTHRNAWHTVFFVQAGETVRRTIDPNHKDYGEVSGYYARIGPVADIVRAEWMAYLSGTKSVDDAIAGIVEGLTAERDKPKAE